MNDCKILGRCSETTQCINDRPSCWSSQNPQRRGQIEEDKVPGTASRLRPDLGWIRVQRGGDRPAAPQRAPSPPCAGRGCQGAGRWREGAGKPQGLAKTAAALFRSPVAFFSPSGGQTSPPRPAPTPAPGDSFRPGSESVNPKLSAPPPLPPKVPKKERCKVG